MTISKAFTASEFQYSANKTYSLLSDQLLLFPPITFLSFPLTLITTDDLMDPLTSTLASLHFLLSHLTPMSEVIGILWLTSEWFLRKLGIPLLGSLAFVLALLLLPHNSIPCLCSPAADCLCLYLLFSISFLILLRLLIF